MTPSECIEYLRGTAENMNDMALEDPDGDVVVDAFEVQEMADTLKAIADILVAFIPLTAHAPVDGPDREDH